MTALHRTLAVAMRELASRIEKQRVYQERTCCRANCARLGVEQSGDGIRWYCERHWKEAIHEGDPSRGY